MTSNTLATSLTRVSGERKALKSEDSTSVEAAFMRTVEYDAYGPCDVLHLTDRPEPGPPLATEIRIRIAATSVNPKDTFVRKGRFRGLTGDRFPKRVGYDWAGVVEAVGSAVTTIAPGERAFGMIDGWNAGTCAGVINVAASEAARAPRAVSLIEAAALPLAALTARQALVDVAAVTAGRRVYVSGASGGVGLFAIAVARDLGALVTAAASGANEALCREMGAAAFANYATQPLEQRTERFDVIFDVFGNLPFDAIRERLSTNGMLVTTVPNAATFASIAATQGEHGRRARLVAVTSRASDLALLSEMVDRGALRVHLDAVYALADIRAAHAHIERKHTRGKVVVELGG